ncbi:putative aldouronate transport system permease protein [Paenibacillus endophyticus]|uniref:Putative aldouronate transport system permease protein n=1 Tax=Paenibacillus endophyticus TaxID=1294268 RepID=A0A7W5G9M8_9BACL|nr:ABC transporter permease subunit [Paenibacillus endophyticus]MBB3151478.1 putative aldouronate transport system permease protein [Paenibacillus endophyticus]
MKAFANLRLKVYWPLYVMAIPGIAFLIVFKYIPLAGAVIAFKDYSVFKGILDSPWVGLKHFETLMQHPDFARVFGNTLMLGFLKLALVFPVPVLLALMINEIRKTALKKGIQTALYIPHFLSWVIVSGIVFDFFSLNGLFNIVLGWLGNEPLLAMQESGYFRPIYVLSSIWRDAGWGTVVYIAAISAIDPQLYESAMMDGASKFRQMRHITFPLLLPTVLVLFLLEIGNFLDLGFDQVYNLITPMTYSVGDILDTYVFRTGIQQAQYSFATAVGLFQSIIGLVMVYIFNRMSKKVSDGGLW